MFFIDKANLKRNGANMKDIIDFLEAYVNGKTLHTKELIYELENGALQGVYSDQNSFSNLKYSYWLPEKKLRLKRL